MDLFDSYSVIKTNELNVCVLPCARRPRCANLGDSAMGAAAKLVHRAVFVRHSAPFVKSKGLPLEWPVYCNEAG